MLEVILGYIIMDMFIIWLSSLLAVEYKRALPFVLGIIIAMFANLFIYFINLGFFY